MKRLIAIIAAAITMALPAATSGTALAANAGGPSLPVIGVAMNGKSVNVSGPLASGAVDVRATVTGEREGELVIVRLNPGVTLQHAMAAVGKSEDPNRLAGLASIVFATVVPRGTSDAQTVLAPGNYGALDFGGHQGAPSRGAPPHTTFTVTASPSPASLPKPGATIEAIDFAFRSPHTLHNGEVVRAINHGYVAHMVLGIGVPSRAAAKKAMALLRAGKDGKAHHYTTHSFFSLAGPLSPGGLVQSTLHAKPGYYILACFMDTQDGREHTQLGMMKLVRVR